MYGAALTRPAIDVGIAVEDAAAMRRFYRDGLGLPLLGTIPVPDGTLDLFGCGNSLVKLYARPAGPRPPAGGYGFTYVTIEVADAAAALARALAAGGTLRRELFDFDVPGELPLPAGRLAARVAMVADPDGNTVELLERR